MRKLQAMLNIVTGNWLTRLLYYAVAFWGLDVIISRLISWQRTEIARIITSLLVAALIILLECRQPALNSEARDRVKIAGMLIALALVSVAALLILTDPR